MFALHNFVALLLALFVAFSLDLARPVWAMLTVFMVSRPFSGALRSRALYRLGGTLLGAAFAVFVTPPLSPARWRRDRSSHPALRPSKGRGSFDVAGLSVWLMTWEPVAARLCPKGRDGRAPISASARGSSICSMLWRDALPARPLRPA
jgi:hypothetical protein